MLDKLTPILDTKLKLLKKEGRLKGKEKVIVDIMPPGDGFGRKIVISDKRTLLNFASNSYLGISNDPRLIKAEHEADLKFGVGPGAVRFISGTQKPHVKLEEKLAQFYKKEAGMIFSSAYAANCGVIAPLMDKDTCIISDELNHNSIIMAIRFAGVTRDRKKIYAHSNVDELRKCIDEFAGKTKRLIIVTDGVFSMRGDYASLKDIANLAEEYEAKFKEGIITVIDDSHGIGAYGKTGRGTPEVTQEDRIDVISATLGKGLGVDDGFIVSNKKVIEYLRESFPLYIYSNPISLGIASAALKALEILDSNEGRELLKKLRENSEYFRKGIDKIGFETIKGIHPIIPVVIGDPIKAKQVVSHLYQRGVYVVALTYPVVPKGQDTIRVQISASHTRQDFDYALKSFKEAGRKEGILKMKTTSGLELIPIGSDYKSILPKHPILAPLPERMKAWVTYRGGKTILEEVSLPKILADDVLIEPLWISICTSDVNKFINLTGNQKKTIFGHEFAGRIVAVGRNVNKALIGQIVIVEEHYPCLECDLCLERKFDKREREGFLGWYKSGNSKDWLRNGAFAEFVSIHKSCLKSTQGIEKLNFFPSLAEPFGNTVKMERIIREKCGRIPETLLIWGGCGAQALYMVPYFASKGTRNFVLIYRGKPAMRYMKRCVTDLDAHFYFVNSEDQKELDRLKRELGQEDGFVSIELTGEKKLQKMVIEYASPRGKIFYYGLPQGGKKVIIPSTNIDIHTFVTDRAGIEELSLNGVKATRVMGRDNESWKKTIDTLKTDAQLRKDIMKPLVRQVPQKILES
ncbi:MAG: hypothetical protein DRH33_07880 [Candidatus Nealsonbacteria bacterium]|nr:MAG: hypothetical protein DRH33_07880 [Candidatus Nealsonbacteria bacterium]